MQQVVPLRCSLSAAHCTPPTVAGRVDGRWSEVVARTAATAEYELTGKGGKNVARKTQASRLNTPTRTVRTTPHSTPSFASTIVYYPLAC